MTRPMSVARFRVELVIAAACWGSDAVAVKYALRGIPAMTVLVIQMFAATSVIWCVFALRGIRRPAQLPNLLLLGLFEPGLTYAAVTLGLLHTSASDASLLSGTESLFVVILAAVFLRQRLKRKAVVAVGAATVGVATLGGSVPTLAAGWGDVLVVSGCLCAAIYVTMASRIAGDLESLTMTAYQFLAGTLVSLPFAAVQWSGSGQVVAAGSTPAEWIAAVGAGVVGLAASFLLYNHAISAVKVTTAGMILNLIPLFGVIGAAAFLGESLNGWQAIGAVLILASLTLFTVAEAGPAEADPTEADPTEADPTEADPTEADPTEADPAGIPGHRKPAAIPSGTPSADSRRAIPAAEKGPSA